MPRKSPDKPEGAEKIRAKKPAKKETAKEGAEVQAILAETASKVEQMNVAQLVEDALGVFFDSHKIGITTDDVAAIIKNTADSAVITSRTSHGANEFILHQLIDIFGVRAEEEFKDGNLYDSLKYLTFVLACVALSGAELDPKYCKQFISIEKRLTFGGKFETLFGQVKPIFDELSQLQPEAVIDHERLIRKLLTKSQQAEAEQRWQDAINIRRQLIQLILLIRQIIYYYRSLSKKSGNMRKLYLQ